jgi:hypothetical protein
VDAGPIRDLATTARLPNTAQCGVFVGVAARLTDRVQIKVFEVL